MNYIFKYQYRGWGLFFVLYDILNNYVIKDYTDTKYYVNEVLRNNLNKNLLEMIDNKKE